MYLFLKHLAVNIQDIVDLGGLARQPFNEQHIARLAMSPVTLLADPDISEEWPEVVALCEGLLASRSGKPMNGGVNPGDQRALYTLIRQIKPRKVLEIGTHLGYSTLHIAEALRRNALEVSGTSHLTTVDIKDVNTPPDAPWHQMDARFSPQEMIAQIGMADHVSFVQSDSVSYLQQSEQVFDFVFLDGDHSAGVVYKELHALTPLLAPETTIVLHDYFPNGQALWKSSLPNTGPWRAIRRLQRDGAKIDVTELGQLPWPTKCGTHLTSLALLQRKVDRNASATQSNKSSQWPANAS